MSGITVIDFCCGRTQHDKCRECGRDFLTTVPQGIEARELPEYRAYQAGLRHGLAIGAGAVAVLAATGMLVWSALQ